MPGLTHSVGRQRISSNGTENVENTENSTANCRGGGPGDESLKYDRLPFSSFGPVAGLEVWQVFSNTRDRSVRDVEFSN